MKLFVDTSAWVALSAKNDKYHRPASTAFAGLKRTRFQLVTTDYILDESLTHLLTHYGHHRAIAFGRWALNSESIQIYRIDDTIWDEAWQMFQQYDDKEWAFTDCTSFMVMQQQQLYQAFTFDRHFGQAGFQLWPVREP
ncbi:MAG: PIN domain-containing protein [Chloroflexota bacterium]